MNAELKVWLASRPENVRRLYAEFPLPARVRIPDGQMFYLIGYTEDDKLILSHINPGEDYAGAQTHKFYMCADHMRQK